MVEFQCSFITEASTKGVALTAGVIIDSLDWHDGFNPAKGNIGRPLFAAIMSIALEMNSKGKEFLITLVMGYEFGARTSISQHSTVPDYHTSGS